MRVSLAVVRSAVSSICCEFGLLLVRSAASSVSAHVSELDAVDCIEAFVARVLELVERVTRTTSSVDEQHTWPTELSANSVADLDVAGDEVVHHASVVDGPGQSALDSSCAH